MKRPFLENVDHGDSSKKTALKDTQNKLPIWRLIVAISCWGLIFFIGYGAIVSGLKPELVKRFENRGDQYFKGEQFEKAGQEYRQALKYTNDKLELDKKVQISEKVNSDPIVAKDLFVKFNMQAWTDDLNKVEADFSTPKEALQVGRDYFGNGKYALARYALEKATSLDPDYPEAWHYLYLDYEKLAGTDSAYRDLATQAREKRDNLTPSYLEMGGN